MLKRLSLVLLLGCVLSLTGALHAQNSLTVLTTNTIIADVAQNVGGDLVTVTSLVPPDTDIHAFQPTPSDVLAASSADLVLVSGAGLEAFLGDLLQGAVDDPARIIVVSNGVTIHAAHHRQDDTATPDATDAAPRTDATAEPSAPDIIGVLGQDAACGDLFAQATPDVTSTEATDEEHGPCDPHVWTDPNNVKIWVDTIEAAFAAADPAHADAYHANAEAYKAKLEALDQEVMQILAVVPPERRVLVTNHDFIGYFAAHYGFEIVGTVIPGVSTLTEPAPQELAALVETIKAQNVPAIFVEASDPGMLANVVAQEVGREIKVVALYSDSLSAADSPAATYMDYLRANAHIIADALQ